MLGSTFYRGISNREQNLPKNCILESILSSISWLFFLSFFKFDDIISGRSRFGISGWNSSFPFLCNPDDWCFANQWRQVQPVRIYHVFRDIYSSRNKMQRLFLHYNVAMDTVCTSLVETRAWTSFFVFWFRILIVFWLIWLKQVFKQIKVKTYYVETLYVI